MNIEIASAYLNGWRQIAIYAKGPEWISAVEVGTLASVQIPRAEERHLRSVTDDPGRLRKLRQRLDAKRRAWKRIGKPPRHSPKIIKRIVEELSA